MRLADARAALKRRRSDRSYTDSALNGFLNDARRDMESRKRWSWLRRVFRWSTHAQDATSITTLALTLGSRTATVSTAASPTMFGRRLLAKSRIIRVVNLDSAGTTWTLDSPWPDASAAGVTPTILFDEVALPLDVDQVQSLVVRESTGWARTLSADTQGQYSLWDPTTSGIPTRYAMVRKKPIPQPIAAPSVSNSGGGSGPATGVYLYWVSYYDKQSGAESGLSPSTSYTQSASAHAVTVAPPSRRDLLSRVYRSRAGGSVPYLVGESGTFAANFSDTVPDDYLGDRAQESANESFLRLWPVPDSVYQVESVCLMRGVDMADDNDRPLFPASFDGVWLDGAAMYMLGAADEQGRLNSPRERFEMGIRRMERQDTVEGSREVFISGNAVFAGLNVGWPDIVQ